MNYAFTNDQVKSFAETLNKTVPIHFIRNKKISDNAMMDYDKDSGSVIIEYKKKQPDELVDILHELIHVDMFFIKGYHKLAYGTNNPQVTSAIKRTVKLIRDIIDDSCVFERLNADYKVFPISPIYFKECRKDCESKKIHLAQHEVNQNKSLLIAWRLQISEMCLNEFRELLPLDKEVICKNFLKKFKNSNQRAKEILRFIHSTIDQMNSLDVHHHANALIQFRDFLGYKDDLLYLAKMKKEGSRYSLTKQ